MKNINFWPYDIFGYFIPGLVLFYSALMTNENLKQLVTLNSFTTSTGGTNFVEAIIWVFLIYIAGHVVASFSSYFLERALVQHFFKFPTDWFFFHTKNDFKCRRCFIQKVSSGYCEPYTDDFKKMFFKKFETTFKLKTTDKADFFWLCQEWLPLNHPVTYKSAMHFLELYGLSRNTCMSFIFISIFPYLPGWSCSIPSVWWTGVSLAISASLFSNYLKLLRRMNDMVYRGFVVSVSKVK